MRNEWTKNLHIHGDHREIHLKNSFCFYWFHINVSFAPNKGSQLQRVGGKATVEKCWYIFRPSSQKYTFIHIRCTFHESIFLCAFLSIFVHSLCLHNCTCALYIPHIAKWIQHNARRYVVHGTRTHKLTSSNTYVCEHHEFWKQNPHFGLSVECGIFEF